MPVHSHIGDAPIDNWLDINNLTYCDDGNILKINSQENAIEWIPFDPELTVTPEELKIRRENAFVRELYEQYKVALILASGDGL